MCEKQPGCDLKSFDGMTKNSIVGYPGGKLMVLYGHDFNWESNVILNILKHYDFKPVFFSSTPPPITI